MMVAASLTAVSVPPAVLAAAGPETQPANRPPPQRPTEEDAEELTPDLSQADSFDGRHGRGDGSIMGWWAMLAAAALLLAPVIGWCVPWRWLRIPLALLVAGPAWLAGGAFGSSIDGFLPMMGACCMGAVFWPVANIALSELFHSLRKTGKRMRQESWLGR